MEENKVKQYYYPNEMPKVTIALVVINVALYAFEANILKRNVWELFGISWNMVWQKEWYKLLTAMFTHGSVAHLGSNMIALYGAGMYLEEKFGGKRFLIYYMIAGLLGEFLGCFFGGYVLKANYVSIGASGAVFGLFGMLIVLSLRKQTYRIPLHRIVLFIALSIADAFTETGVDIWGHAAGFVTGIAMGLLYSFTAGKKTQE